MLHGKLSALLCSYIWGKKLICLLSSYKYLQCKPKAKNDVSGGIYHRILPFKTKLNLNLKY